MGESIEVMMAKAISPIERLFNLHKWCDLEWCWAKRLDNKKLELTPVNMKEATANNLDMQISDSNSGSDTDSDSGLDSEYRITSQMIVGTILRTETRMKGVMRTKWTKKVSQITIMAASRCFLAVTPKHFVSGSSWTM